jgi:hypothetical protein
MPKTLLVLILSTLVLAPQRAEDLRVVRMWIADAQNHTPASSILRFARSQRSRARHLWG